MAANARRLKLSGMLSATLLLLILNANLMSAENQKPTASKPQPNQQATLGGGCFWCLEAAFKRLDGVLSVTSGYAGGRTVNPTYKEVCTDTTGHAEVIQIEFDPQKISFDKLLDFFWKAHDPTTWNRQGGDVGSQYRSIILYHDETQKRAAEQSKAKAAKMYNRVITTEIVPLKHFYPAESYHQDYFQRNPNVPYCVNVIQPKLKKLEQSH